MGTLSIAEVLELDCVREFFKYTRQWTYMAGYGYSSTLGTSRCPLLAQDIL